MRRFFKAFSLMVLCTAMQSLTGQESDRLSIPSLEISVTPQEGSPTLPGAITEALLMKAALESGQRLEGDRQKATHILKAGYLLKDLSTNLRFGKASVSIDLELQENSTGKTLWRYNYSGEKTPALSLEGRQSAYFQAFFEGARKLSVLLMAAFKPTDLQTSSSVTSFWIQVLSPEGSPPGIKSAAESTLGRLLGEQGFHVVPLRQQADHGLELRYILQSSSSAPGMYQGSAVLVLMVREFSTGRILFTEVYPSPPSMDRSSQERADSQAVTSTLTQLVPGLRVLKAQETSGR